MPDVEVVALCDAYTGRSTVPARAPGGKAIVYKDYRDLLASPSVDAVFIAHADHWHKTMALDALAARKTSTSKTLSFTNADGQRLSAVERSNRFCRSQPGRQFSESTKRAS